MPPACNPSECIHCKVLKQQIAKYTRYCIISSRVIRIRNQVKLNWRFFLAIALLIWCAQIPKETPLDLKAVSGIQSWTDPTHKPCLQTFTVSIKSSNYRKKIWFHQLSKRLVSITTYYRFWGAIRFKKGAMYKRSEGETNRGEIEYLQQKQQWTPRTPMIRCKILLYILTLAAK